MFCTACRSVELYTPATDSWETGDPLPMCLPFVGCVGVAGGPVVVGGKGLQCPVMQYRRDRRTGRASWAELNTLATPRIHTAVAALGPDVFVIVRAVFTDSSAHAFFHDT